MTASGDTHGCSASLWTLLAVVAPRPQDTVVALRNAITHGLDAKGRLRLLGAAETGQGADPSATP